MVDTIRQLDILQGLLADNIVEGISPQDVRDFLISIYSFVNANMVPWTPSTSLVDDSGGEGRFRIARAGFIFKGPDFLDPTRAGSLVQIGEYPSLPDGLGSYVGAAQTAVFITQDDMFNAIGPPETYGGIQITGQNSAAIPNYFGMGFWIERNSDAGDVWGMEIDVLNRGSDGAGLGIVISGNRNYSGTTYADRGLVITSAGTPNGSPDADSANWLAGIQIDGLVPSLGNAIIISDGVTGSLGMVNGIHMKDVWGGFSHAAIFIHNLGKIMWTTADGSADGAAIWDNANNDLVVQAGTHNQFYFSNHAATYYPLVLDAAAPTSGQTGLLVGYHNGGSVVQFQRVTTGIVDSGGVGYKLLRVPN